MATFSLDMPVLVAWECPWSVATPPGTAATSVTRVTSLLGGIAWCGRLGRGAHQRGRLRLGRRRCGMRVVTVAVVGLGRGFHAPRVQTGEDGDGADDGDVPGPVDHPVAEDRHAE